MGKKKTSSVRSSLLLVLAAFIWGTAFVAQSEGMAYIGVFTFIGCRYLLGGAVLIPVFLAMRKIKHEEYEAMGEENVKNLTKRGIKGGLCCGICLFIASALQQIGIVYTTVGKAGFITTLYIVLVPVFGIFLHKKAGANVWISVSIAVVGMYLLCINEQFSIAKGDIYVIGCAIVFSVHILLVDHFSPNAESLLMSIVQFFTCGVLGSVIMFIFEKPDISSIIAAALPICYAGLLSSGVAYTLQIVVQKDLDPTVASLIMSLESVFALLSGWVILGQKLSMRELFGCVLMMTAIIIVQLPEDKFFKRQKA